VKPEGKAMFSKLFLSEKDLEAIQQALTRNPLLASLLMISPMDAFKYLNLMPRFFDALLPAPAEDARLIQQLMQALEEGRTALRPPQSPPVDGSPAAPHPAQPAGTPSGVPDVTLNISKATLQRAVKLYAESNFQKQEFIFTAQRWLDVNARGESIELDLAQERARLIVKLRGTFAFRAVPPGLDRLSGKVGFPIELDLLAALAVDQENHLALRVGEGEMSILNPPLPDRVASELVRKIVEVAPSIPLVQVPARFEIPGDPAMELLVRQSHVSVDTSGLKLEFYLDD
jgi:hypothetical protein